MDFLKGVCDQNPVNFMGIAASSKIRGVFYVKFELNEDYNLNEFIGFVFRRISSLIVDIVKLDFHLI